MSFLRISLAVLALAASFGSAQAFNPQPDPPGRWKMHVVNPEPFGFTAQLHATQRR
jgi:hypothetical protein